MAKKENSFDVVDQEQVEFQKMDVAQRTDPNWTEVVLNNLADDEQVSGFPKADGLRRLVEVYIGPILSLETKVHVAPSYGKDQHDSNMASVTSYLTVYDREQDTKTMFTASADASGINTPDPFGRHLVAIAETRAEGRVYRKILRLKNVVTSEEMSGSEKLQTDQFKGKVTTATVDFLRKFCDSSNLDINIEKLFHHILDDDRSNIFAYSREDAILVNEAIQKYRKDKKTIPDAIKGFDSSLNQTFLKKK